MLKRLKLSLVGIFALVGIAGGVVGATIPSGTAGAACGTLLTFPQWYKGLTDGSCKVMSPEDFAKSKGMSQPEIDKGSGLSLYIWAIALNVLEIVLQIIGYIAMFYVIYGGFIYLTSNGSPDRASQGLKTIINSSIGVAIGLSAIAIKNLAWAVVISGSTVNEFGVYKIDAGEVIKQGLQTVYFIAGAVAVIVVIINGLNYITSSGDPGKVTKAKKGLLYGLIGIGIVLAASVVTAFIASRF